MRRVLDICVAIVGIVAAAPIAAVVAVLIWTAMGRPVFFRQSRVGLDGALFTVWKFRTMRPETWPGQPDGERTPRLGALLRASSLDELPQLWNILRGDMSLIGPRPTLPEQVVHYTARQRGRLAVRPGLTGWAQVNGRNFLSWPDRIELDLWYLAHRGPLLDMRILLRTVARLMRPEGVLGAGGINPDFPVPAQRDAGPDRLAPVLVGVGPRSAAARLDQACPGLRIRAPADPAHPQRLTTEVSISPAAPQRPYRPSSIGTLEASVSSYLRVLSRYWALVVIGLVIGLTIAAAITFTTTPTYASRMIFLLSVPGSSDPSNAEQKAQTYVELLTIERVGEGVVRSLGLNEQPADFAERVSARVEANTMIVSTTVTDSSPLGAQRIATSLGDTFAAIVAELEQVPGALPAGAPAQQPSAQQPSAQQPSALTVRVVQPATLPGDPIAPVMSLNLGLGAILGILAGIGLALAVDRARGRLDDPEPPTETHPALGPTPTQPIASTVGSEVRTES